jgi:tRNA 2-selenouridine synthase
MPNAPNIPELPPAPNSGEIWVDVRTPAEFAQGHIPGAVNLPLLRDEERAEVGTLYVQSGRMPAVLAGLRCVGARLADLAESLAHLAEKAGDEGIVLHCWRGGMRSQSVAWLAETIGLRNIRVLPGGYKSYRRWALASIGLDRAIHVVSGLTGSGKTHVLHALARQGENVIDLEALAHHKGSAFGSLGEAPQPTQEQFENDLALAWHRTQPASPVWIEDESRTVGKRVIPAQLWEAKIQAPHFVLQISDDARIAHLCSVYQNHPPQVLVEVIRGIAKRLGNDRVAAAVAAVEQGDMATACRIVLAYYDRTYHNSIQKKSAVPQQNFPFDEISPDDLATALRNSDLANEIRGANVHPCPAGD